ncbi:MAG: ABC transporter substrate-binding protein [Caldilinea sp. CFX5]|nr:ABC transporter substrate-binding protein [Caldilinea sp. CFX5]
MNNRIYQPKHHISRRQFLQIAGTVAMGVMATQQRQSANANPAQSGTTPNPIYSEAPMLADRVAQGQLPSVDQRLPVIPCFMPVVENVGGYGDVIRRAHKGAADRFGPTKMVDHGLVWFDKALTLQAHIAEAWTVNDDATEWTFALRAGMKWSDGQPFTTADIQWWYDHELTNADLTPTPPGRFTTGPERTLMQLTVVDAQTVKFTFAHPYPLFAHRIARADNAIYAPAHYLAHFHLATTANVAALQQEALQAGFDDWVGYYQNRSAWYLNPDKPSLAPWVAKNALAENTFIMERNPYFFGVDSIGKQLPYIDVVRHEYAVLDRLIDDWVGNGNLDFQARHISSGKLTVYQQGEGGGDYKVITGVSAGHLAIQLNLTTLEPKLRTFFQDQRVRRALSLAVDRTALSQQFYGGMATPRQYSPLTKSPQYHASLATAYISYDVNQANTLLDQAGYRAKDAAGFRLWPAPDSGRIRFIVVGTAEAGTTDEQAVQKVLTYFAAVGVAATYQPLDRATYETRVNNNQIEAAWWGGDRTILPLLAPEIFLGLIFDRPWAVAWGAWRNDPAHNIAEEPPQGHWIRDIWTTWDQLAVTTDATEQTRLFKQILAIWARELPMIGFLGELPAPVIKKSGLRNYVAGYPLDDTTGDEHLLNPETLFWETPQPMATLNYATGQPGSYFTLKATNFPANQTAMISVNDLPIATTTTDPSGAFTAVLDTRELPIGSYVVKTSVNPAAKSPLILAADQPLRTKEGTLAPVVIPLAAARQSVYLPLIAR